ncbi:MAG: tetratricopeptide repeat protein [Dehalococcoidia bacterium]|nr:tetratricopeptide repeat protein [Dehalococcoidia bacterium]
MSERKKSSGTARYFEVLGLPLDAGGQDIEVRYQELSAYLTSGDLPPQLQDWAREQAARVDEAYAVLSDPDLRAGLEDELEEEAVAAPAVSSAIPAPVRSTRNRRAAARLPLMALALGIFIGVAALVAVIIAEMGLGGGSSEDPAAAQQTQDDQFVPIDTERVAELVTSYQEDPTNPETLFELGEAYFLAGEWQQGQEWFTKLVDVDPANVHAWTDIGTSHYNLGRPEEAKAAWQKALELAPDDAQLHYNMGFLYANSETPDFEAARREWQAVLDLAPGTQLAQTVQVHMEGLQAGASPEASPGA